MDEDTSPAVETTEAPPQATETPTPAEGAETPAAEAEKPEAAPYDWRKALDDAPADELRRHPKFAGVVGTEKQRWLEDYRVQKQTEDDANARRKADDDLREMARANPVAFADKWLSSEEARAQQERLTGLETNARQAVAHSVGAAFHAIPEWAAVRDDPDSLAQLAQAVQGKPPNEEIPAFNAKAVDLVAEHRARARFEQWKTTELAKERDALRTEITAEVLQGSSRPDLVRAARNAQRGSWENLDLNDPKFHEEFERHERRRR